MIKHLYTIKDHATEQHHANLMPADTDKEAIRILSGALVADSLLKNNPLDFSLHRIGSFSTDSGEIFVTEKSCILPDLLSIIPQHRENASQIDIED